MIHYSVIIPLHNEESSITDLIEELEPVMQSLSQPWELICIDDGSTDQTKKVVSELGTIKPYLKLIVLIKTMANQALLTPDLKQQKEAISLPLMAMVKMILTISLSFSPLFLSMI